MWDFIKQIFGSIFGSLWWGISTFFVWLWSFVPDSIANVIEVIFLIVVIACGALIGWVTFPYVLLFIALVALYQCVAHNIVN